MTTKLSDQELQAALEECASEPAHIPNQVQPFGALVAMDPQKDCILYASENCEVLTGHTAHSLLNASFKETFGREIVHALNNAASQPNFTRSVVSLGVFDLNGQSVEIGAFKSGDLYVLEFEREAEVIFNTDQALDALSLLIENVEKCTTQSELFDVTAELMQHLTGYDRIMIYRFDQDFNGEIIAERKRRKMETFLGLRFPSYDIPAQARALMAKLPIRFIEDIDQKPVPMLAAHNELPPLDMTYAAARGVSAVHMEYLRNMGTQATMTLSIVVGGELWGMISFHHASPQVPPARLRNILARFVPIFAAKLETLQQRTLLDQINNVDQIKDRLLIEIDDDTEMEAYFPTIAKTTMDVLKACGLSAIIGTQSMNYGQVPSPGVLKELLALAHQDETQVVSIKNLGERFPDLKHELNGIGGALAHAIKPGWAICFFREEAAQEISWAGNPEKTIEHVAGRARLKPLGSFMTYLQRVAGSCTHWTEQDLFFTHRVWTIINSAERRSLLNTLNRQQAIMIDELNHRVRNILALVRSVSGQARRRYGSLNSYSKSLESRIQALAAVHDITSGTSTKAIDLQTLIRAEFGPYQDPGYGHVKITGANPHLRPDTAPIFSLVVHELTTNAAKYGALSVDTGQVDIAINEAPEGYEIFWQESGGPAVSEPAELGFGSALIRQAIPHEIDGISTLDFKPEGVVATILLPKTLFDTDQADAAPVSEQADVERRPSLAEKVGMSVGSLSGIALILEDNFVIAKEMGDQLEEFGFDEVVKFANVDNVLTFLESERPKIAVLDVNLGKGSTNEEAALRLSEMNVPFIFVTGYGERGVLSDKLDNVLRLTKPVETEQLKSALMLELSKQ